MAMTQCPECGKTISSKAAACPEYGCPASEFYKAEPDNSFTTVSRSGKRLFTSRYSSDKTEVRCKACKEKGKVPKE